MKRIYIPERFVVSFLYRLIRVFACSCFELMCLQLCLLEDCVAGVAFIRCLVQYHTHTYIIK